MIEVMPEANKAPRRSKRMVFLAIFFVIVLAVIVYSSFFADISITGDLINENKTVGIPINADFNSVPNLSIKGEFSRVSIRGLTGTFLYIGDQKFPMNGSDRIFLTDYEGKISLSSNNLEELDGKVSHISIDGLPILPSSDKELKIYIKDSLEYSSLDISQGVFMRKLNYITSGKIVFGEKKSVVNLNEDNVIIDDFFGGIEVKNKGLSLDGTFEKLETKGNHEISVSA